MTPKLGNYLTLDTSLCVGQFLSKKRTAQAISDLLAGGCQ